MEIEDGDQVVIETISGGPDQVPAEKRDALLADHAAFIADGHRFITAKKYTGHNTFK